MTSKIANLILLAFALAIAAPRAAQAAESYDNCTGFITSLPAVINTQGTWCLNKDLATAITSGDAIFIQTNNVTLDCNNFKLGGLAAGVGTGATGIHAYNLSNITVRHCNVRGFFYGLYFEGTLGGHHAVEDNRFDTNTYIGVQVNGDGSVIRRNRIFDTGGTTWTPNAIAIDTTDSVDVLDNTVSGVAATAGLNGNVYGIFTMSNTDARISNNGIRGLAKDGTGTITGIHNQASDRLTMRDNDLVGDGSAGSIGLTCNNNFAHSRDNGITGFGVGINNCSDDAGNIVAP